MLYLLIIQTVIVQTTAPSSEAGIMSTWGLWSRAIYDHGGCYIPQTKQLHSSSCPRTAKLGGRTEHSPLYFVEHAGRMPDTLCRSQFHSIHWFLRLPQACRIWKAGKWRAGGFWRKTRLWFPGCRGEGRSAASHSEYYREVGVSDFLLKTQIVNGSGWCSLTYIPFLSSAWDTSLYPIPSFSFFS